MASLNTEAPIITRDGRPAYIVATGQTVSEGGGYVYPIRAAVVYPNEPGSSIEWNYLADGRWKSNEHSNHNDIINYRPN